MTLPDSIVIDGKSYKPTIFAIQAQSSFAKSLIFLAEARVAIRRRTHLWAAIATYYSLFHLTHSLMFMSPQLVDAKLLRELLEKRGSDGGDDPTKSISHRCLPKFLKNCELRGLSPRLRELLEKSKKIREEYVNYGPRVIWRGETPTFLTHGFRPSDVQRITLSVAPLLGKSLRWAHAQHSSAYIIITLVSASLGWFLERNDMHYKKWCSEEVLAEAQLLKSKLPFKIRGM